ncbi:sensor histidine kinase [Paenibacillus sp. GCM10023252]|uniref:sensor histidine kinase n=1 Tax=Paenibacillus sp. GCM10023252 TaxID=3252649 RepID=UPI0036080E04
MILNKLRRLINGRSDYLSFGYKLMISYLIFVLIPVSTVGYFAYRTSVESIREQARDNLHGTLLQMRDNITYKSEEMKKISDQLFFDLTLQKMLRTYRAGWTSYETLQSYILPTLHNAVTRDSSRMQMRIYFDEETVPEIYEGTDSTKNPLADVSRFDLYHLSRLADKEWFQSLPWASDGAIPVKAYKGNEYTWRQVENDSTYNNLSMIRRMIDFDKQSTFGLIRIITELDYLLAAADYHKISDNSGIVVLDEHERPLHSSGSPEVLANMEANIPLSSDSLRIEENLPGLNWKLIAFIPNEVLERDAKKVRNITLLVCFISVIVLLVIGAFISRYFSVRVQKVITSMNALRSGEFTKRIYYSGSSKDEFTQIADAFNKMGTDIDELIQEVYLANIQKKEAELETLQAQINPHFLYNTLSSISRLAKFGEIDKLHDMVMGLAKFYRLTLNEGKTLIPIMKELEQAKTYIEIQQIKYRDKLEVWYDIKAEVFGHETIKIIIQPFIENALEHAFFGSRMTIKLCAYVENDRIVFLIIDDGIGMSKDQLEESVSTSRHSNGYGIRNVDERIKLQYGPDYGVTFGSGVGIGTTVRIEIPANKTGSSQ